MEDKIVVTDQEHVLREDRGIIVNNAVANSSLSAKYHQSEIEQNAKVINHSILMIWVGIALLAIGMFLSTNSEQGIFVLIPGAFIDIFSGTMIHLVNKSSETKHKYFENLSVTEQQQRLLELIESSDDSQFKKEMLSKFVEKQCKD